MIVVAGAACVSPWTARVCPSTPDGRCTPAAGAAPSRYTVQLGSAGLVQGPTDVPVDKAECANGFAQVDVQVIGGHDLAVTVYCRGGSARDASTADSASVPSFDAGAADSGAGD